jgi:hypothetical protein
MSREELGERTKLPDTREYLKASEEYMVEAIFGHAVRPRKDGNQRMFRICWEGYGPADDIWVSKRDLRNALALKREYLRLRPKKSDECRALVGGPCVGDIARAR